MPSLLDDLWRKPDQQILLFLIACAGILAMALGLEHIGGYLPCELCLKERYAYYAGIPLAIGASAAISSGKRGLAAALIGLAALGMFANAWLGLYHAGIEWHWWTGPTACTSTTGLATDAGDLLKSLQTQDVIRCDMPALKMFGLSLAAWNIPIGLGLAALGGLAAWRLSKSVA